MSNGLLQGVSEGLRLGLQGFIGERDRRDKRALMEQAQEAKRIQLARELQRDEEARQARIGSLIQGGAEVVEGAPREGLITYQLGDKTLGFDPKAKHQRALEVAMARGQAENAVKGTPAEQAIDKKYAEQYADYVLGGGKAQAEANLAKVSKAATDVVEKDASGGFLQKLPFGNDLTRVFQPEKAAVRQDVESVVMSNLRQALGPQFTEKEGAKVLQTTFDPALPPKIIQERLNALSSVLAQQNAAKEQAAEYLMKNKTMRGYKGPQPLSLDQINDKIAAIGGKSIQSGGLISEANATGASGLTSEQRKARIQELRKKLGK